MLDVLSKLRRTRSGHFELEEPGKYVKHEMETIEHPTMEQKKFVKAIRPVAGMYQYIFEMIRDEFKATPDLSKYDQKLEEVLSDSQRAALLDSLMINMMFPKSVAKYGTLTTKNTMLFPNCIYTHMAAGLADFTMEERGMENVKDAYRYVTYYRSGVQAEELYRLGYSRDDVLRIVAKQHFTHLWAGDPFGPEKDPEIFSHFKRVFYPQDCHVTEGSTDLGRGEEMETARLWSHNFEGDTLPVTILSSGDTGFFTDGALNSVQHLVEASERGFKMPIIYLVNMNNR
jgi:hypothetical protein